MMRIISNNPLTFLISLSKHPLLLVSKTS